MTFLCARSVSSSSSQTWHAQVERQLRIGCCLHQGPRCKVEQTQALLRLPQEMKETNEVIHSTTFRWGQQRRLQYKHKLIRSRRLCCQQVIERSWWLQYMPCLLNLTMGATERKGVFCSGTIVLEQFNFKFAARERQLPHWVDFDDLREAPGFRLLARRSAYVSRCRAFFCSHSSASFFRTLISSRRWGFTLSMIPIAFPEHGAHDAAHEFFEIILRLLC